jgi:hypothetical protein
MRDSQKILRTKLHCPNITFDLVMRYDLVEKVNIGAEYQIAKREY